MKLTWIMWVILWHHRDFICFLKFWDQKGHLVVHLDAEQQVSATSWRTLFQRGICDSKVGHKTQDYSSFAQYEKFIVLSYISLWSYPLLIETTTSFQTVPWSFLSRLYDIQICLQKQIFLNFLKRKAFAPSHRFLIPRDIFTGNEVYLGWVIWVRVGDARYVFPPSSRPR